MYFKMRTLNEIEKLIQVYQQKVDLELEMAYQSDKETRLFHSHNIRILKAKLTTLEWVLNQD